MEPNRNGRSREQRYDYSNDKCTHAPLEQSAERPASPRTYGSYIWRIYEQLGPSNSRKSIYVYIHVYLILPSVLCARSCLYPASKLTVNFRVSSWSPSYNPHCGPESFHLPCMTITLLGLAWSNNDWPIPYAYPIYIANS